MVRGRDCNGIDVPALLFEEVAPIEIEFCFWEFLAHLGGLAFIGIAEGNDLFAAAAGDIYISFAANADGGDAKFLVRGDAARAVSGTTGEGSGSGGGEC
jgi:hypothetical protein